MRRIWIVSVLLALLANAAHAADKPSAIPWQPWSEHVFQQARQQNKFVLLDLEAVWCHWCHVMEDKTYGDAAVIQLLQSRFITVKVDQDANPDLAVRYEDYGWPATIIFAADGSELVKRRGYIPPQPMAALLQAVIDNATPASPAKEKTPLTAGSSTRFSAVQRDKILADLRRGYDQKVGGWTNPHKYILAPNMEYALMRAQQGEQTFAAMARQTLDAALLLSDPVWGGFYQYSDRGRWDSPHFEKIMGIQADNMRLYALAYTLFQEPRYLKAARDSERYLADFLTSPEGAFYTSQDANVSLQIDGHAYYPLGDKQRRALGMPRIDRHLYARENGWAIRGLTVLYEATGEKQTLQRAMRAANWITQNRRLPGGGFSHDAKDRAGPYLGDTLAMAEAYVALYTASGDRQWLKLAQAASDFMHGHFSLERGYATAVIPAGSVGVFREPVLQMEENVAVARVNNLLFRYTGSAVYRQRAEHAVRYLVSLAHGDHGRYLVGPLMAAAELAAEPAHITIVGAKRDAAAQALHREAIRYPALYRRIEWWDRAEGPMPNPDVQYPDLGKAAAFICIIQACSTPIFEPARIAPKADLLFEQQ